MYLLGVNLADNRLVRRALRSFYGINFAVGRRICARFQIHETCRVHELTDSQIAALGAFLSSPATVAPPLRCRRAAVDEQRVPLTAPAPPTERSKLKDVLAELKLETEGRRVVRENIAHHREIGTYRGRRHAMQYPVRGQRTRTNAKTAKKLNRIDRRGFATW
ncbi:mitochondrial 30S ribosomal protein S13 [Calocera viscosa TUFC12733]|uniref:Small ribosomal subunit protein uS13m n=1 Tax=Calocera viscosa (strain TUFC12733) TaxID=1330018 RepID=A0A167NJV9_CALVF|nr:mitochondrial 30S ribosomal protein S13 [Calocera viscosa TUFC12733]